MAPMEFVPLMAALLSICIHFGDSQLACMDGSSVMNHKVELHLFSKKNITGHWITNFTASNESPKLPNKWNVDVLHSVSCSDGLQKHRLQAILVVPPPIPLDYTLYHGVGYYKMHPKAEAGFDGAMNTCIKEGAHLAIINSKAEESVIRSMVKQGSVYLGFHDRAKEGEFMTVLGEPLNSTGFNAWLPNEPNNLNGKEHCGSYYLATGGFNDTPCDMEFPFICEFQLAWA